MLDEVGIGLWGFSLGGGVKLRLVQGKSGSPRGEGGPKGGVQGERGPRSGGKFELLSLK